MGDIQCADITIVDDDLPQGNRNFTISLGGGGTYSDDSGGSGGDSVSAVGSGGEESETRSDGGVRVDNNFPSIDIHIELDVDDSKFVISNFKLWYY